VEACSSGPRPSDLVTRKPCDGSAADYKRHRRRGEEACPESKKAWALYVRRAYHTGIYLNLPMYPGEENLYRVGYWPPKRRKRRKKKRDEEARGVPSVPPQEPEHP
jgi:hypothetical protein